MRRRGAAKADVQRVRSAYQTLFFGEESFAPALIGLPGSIPGIRWLPKS
jgi:hypothetical protein